ncbi:Uncharacterized protein APZ42_031479, partial [Daphnia magna]
LRTMPGKKGTWLVDDNWFAYYQHGQNYARYRQYLAAQNPCPARLILQPCGRYKMTTAHNGHPNKETDIHRNAVHDACILMLKLVSTGTFSERYRGPRKGRFLASRKVWRKRLIGEHDRFRKSLDGQTDIYRGLVTTPNDGSALVFLSSRLLFHIRRSKTLFSDATFLVVPIGSYQLFTVHIALNNHVFPVVYVLMTTKRQAFYQVVFDRLMEIIAEEVPGNGFLVESLISDFETAILNVMQASFLNSRVMGCWFHFGQFNHDNIMSQAIYRYACSDELHLQVAYRERAALKRTVKMLIALALLPVNQARAGLDAVI